MKMFWTIIIILIILGSVWYIYTIRPWEARIPRGENQQMIDNKTSQDMMQNQQQQNMMQQVDQSQGMMQNQNQMMQTMMVNMMGTGFSPNDIKVKVGQTVKFVNKDTAAHWPASGPHPQHTCYAGFDAKGPIAPGGAFEFKFDEAKTCKFHDHMNPSLGGTITVE